MPGPLDGIRIIDVSAIVSGPLTTMVLAAQGAEVIKVEPKEYGDPIRQRVNARGGMTALFANCNRGKRSIALDLKSPKGQDIIYKLVRSADVFVQNWRPGAAARLGFGESDLRAIQPELIYASISGYGNSGPYHDQRVYDPILQGLTGFITVQQNQDIQIPDLVRSIIIDKATAWMTAQAITAALFARERGAGGQSIHVPMIDAGMAFFFPDGMMKHTMLGDGVVNPSALYETYRLWETADGHLVYFTATQREMAGLYRALGHAEWSDDPRFRGAEYYKPENQAELGSRIQEALHSKTTAELVERLRAEDVPAGPVLSLEEVFDDPQIRENQTVLEDETAAWGRYRVVRPPAQFSVTPQSPGRHPPLHGEHGAEILQEIGYREADIEALRKEGVIG